MVITILLDFILTRLTMTFKEKGRNEEIKKVHSWKNSVKPPTEQDVHCE